MKKLLILLVILLLGSCKPNWNSTEYPIRVRGISIYTTTAHDTLYSYNVAREGRLTYKFKSYSFYNIGDTIKITNK